MIAGSRRRWTASSVGVAALVGLLHSVPGAHGTLTAGIGNRTDTVASNIYTCANEAKGNGNVAAFFTLPFGESSGTTARDIVNSNDGTYTSSGVTYGVGNGGLCPRDNTTVVTLDGSAGYVSDNTQFTNGNGPQVFTVEIWFKAATNKAGGKLIGYGNSQTGASTSYDRHLYLDKNNNLVFGVYPGASKTVTDTNVALNDNTWHLADGTYSSATGTMNLYLDGANVGSLTGVTYAQKFAGYWRIGYDALSTGWSNAPSSAYFSGSLAYASVFYSALTAEQIKGHYLVGKP